MEDRLFGIFFSPGVEFELPTRISYISAFSSERHLIVLIFFFDKRYLVVSTKSM